VLRSLLLVPLCLAAYWSARLAYADLLYRRDTLEDTRRAVRLDPANARYLAWLAELEEHEGQDPAPTLTRAARLDPRDSAVHIRLGLLAEQRGDFSGAERELLAAATLDRQFDPRATLAHYYFRRGDAPHFWRSVRDAFAVSYGDLTPLFDLCWRMTTQPEIVRAALPSDGSLTGRYLSFLLATGRLEAAAAIAPEFARHSAAPDLTFLLAACDRFLEREYLPAALSTWNALCGRLLPYPTLAPAQGLSLTNSGFVSDPVLHGFDWRIPVNPEISVTRADSPPALRIALSSRQPENCELLAQYAPLAPHRRYRFRFHYRTDGAPHQSGLHWLILAADAAIPASAADTVASFVFVSGESALARLALVYRRPAGSPRLEGSITLRELALGFAE